MLLAGVAAAALVVASVVCGWLARSLLIGSVVNAATREILAGLVAALPSILLAATVTAASRPRQAATIGISSAVTYLLLAPVLLPVVRSATPSVWQTWRRAVLPFTLATAAMWFVAAAGGKFSWLQGQFFVTLFVLGTWLFKLDRSPRSQPDVRPAEDTERRPGQPLGRPMRQSDKHLQDLRRPASVALVTTAGFAVVALAAAAAGNLSRIDPLVPIAGAVACIGPLVFAAQDRSASSDRWLGALGVTVMACCCLVPGIAGLFQPGRVSAGLYGPDGAVLALAAALWLGLGDDASRSQPVTWVAAVAAWCIWVVWIIASAI